MTLRWDCNLLKGRTRQEIIDLKLNMPNNVFVQGASICMSKKVPYLESCEGVVTNEKTTLVVRAVLPSLDPFDITMSWWSYLSQFNILVSLMEI